MSLTKRGKYYHYEFEYKKTRYRGSTGQELRDDAERFETELRRRIRRQVHGLEPASIDQTPGFSVWAGTCLTVKRKKLRRLDVYERTMRMVLAFWGRRPTARAPVEGGVYRDLRLGDPIADPTLIDEFEAWMDGRKIEASTKLSYLSMLNGMYRLAMKPRYRQRTGVTINPFAEIDRPRRRRRRVELPPEDLRAWLEMATPHCVLALTAGALMPKLRLDQVLALDFARHFDRELTTVTFEEYKSVDQHGGEPQVTPVPDELREILLVLRRARPGTSRVITFRGRPVKSIRTACKRSALRAGLKWGVKGGVTFHALRHAFASESAVIGISEVLASAALDHKDPRTTRQHYTHVRARQQKAVMDTIAKHYKISDVALKAVGAAVGADERRIERSERRRSRLRRRITRALSP